MNDRLFVPHTPELDRVLALPRRDWLEGADDLARRVTDLLRSPVACRACGGHRDHVKGCDLRRIPLSLRSHQAVGLVEAAMYQGSLMPIGVGKGKTLIWLLLAYVLESKRPMLVCPAGLIPKAERNWRELAVYWLIPNWLRMISYEVLGRVSAKDELTNFAPDLLAFDEVHRLKSRKAAVTRRVEVHIEHHREHERKVRHCRLCDAGVKPMALVHVHDATHATGRTRLRVVGMSGTITTKSLRDFAHISKWCVPEHHPLPHTHVELERWRLAIDESVNVLSRIDAGALLQFCDSRENDAPDQTTAVRRGYARRLRETPGIVVTTDDTVRASLSISAFNPPPSPAIEDAFLMLRGDSSKDARIVKTPQGDVEIPGDARYSGWKLPDGWALVDGVEVYAHALELALGFYYVWDPRPPEFWLEARRLWGAFVRKTIRLGKYDSDLDVANHAHEFRTTVNDMLKIVNDDKSAEHADPTVGNKHVYDHWRDTRDTFKRKQKAIWICDSMLKAGKAWLDSHPRGILWTAHVAFGEKLTEFSGYPYCGQEGRDATGRLIDDVTGPVIASVRANSTGRDLQFKWSDNLLLTAIAEAAQLEQLYARTHRDGQDEDTVNVQHFLGCVEHASSFEVALGRARYIEDVGTQPQKLNFADVTVPSVSEIEQRPGARWSKDRV